MNDIQKNETSYTAKGWLDMKKLINEYGSLFPLFAVVTILVWQVLGIWR